MAEMLVSARSALNSPFPPPLWGRQAGKPQALEFVVPPSPARPRAFAARDQYSWRAADLRGRTLEVRVVGKDRAGLEMASRVVTLQAAGSTAGLGEGSRPPTGRTGSGFGSPDDVPARPEIQYVDTRTLTIESKVTRLTRSGVKAAELWVNDGKTGWKKVKSEPALGITPATPDPTVRIEYTVPKDGLYGFIVIPRPIRDWIYDFIATHRYRWFGTRDSCMVPTPELRARFLE